MLTYPLKSNSTHSLYMQLYYFIKKDILSGVLRPNDKLPSKRTFAKHLGISIMTIESAYGQLQVEGYIESVPQKGFYVSVFPTTLPPTVPSISHQQSLIPQSKSYPMDLLRNQSNPNTFPFSVWSKLTRHVLSEHSDEVMVPCPCSGRDDLRHAIANELRQYRYMNVHPDQIIIGAGTEYLYALIIQLLGRDKRYGIENPGYPTLAKIYQCNQVDFDYISVHNFGLDLGELRQSSCQIVHLSPSHQFPTGSIMPIGKRYELLAWAKENPHRYIIEDDYDSEFRLSGQPIPTIQSIDSDDKVIYMNTFSKSLASTIRISYMVLPTPLAKTFYRSLGFYSCTVSTLQQMVLARFLNDGYFERHINYMTNTYRHLRDTLLHEIKRSPLSSHLKFQGEDSGLHFLITHDFPITDKELIERAKQHHLLIGCISQYYSPNTVKKIDHTLVINYSSLLEEMVPQVVHALCQCFNV